MAEKLKLSSPSSSSNSGTSNHATPPRNQGSSSDLSLLIVQQPPLFLFPNELFEFKVGLDVPKSLCESPPDNIAIVATLLGGEIANPGNDAPPFLWINLSNTKRPMQVSSTKPCVIQCRIQASPSKHVRRDKRMMYYISVATRDADSGIISCQTVPIQLVNYKIRISTDAQWSNVWYKDEGGRDKCMEVLAELIDRDDRRHKERIPLKLTLCYAAPNDASSARTSAPTKVTNQEIFRMLGSANKMQTDKTTGKTTIRFRVEDVSKNHQGQDFVLQVAAESRKGYWDVAPGYSPSVSVRSKRNKRQRSSSAARSQGSERRHSPSMPSSSLMFAQGIEHEQQRVAAAASLDGTDIARLREAIKGVVNWAEEVVSGIYPLQWQILGYAPLPDGSPDYSHPYHNMPNPNACISRLLTMYSESTRDHLWVLQQAVEKASPMHMRGGDAMYGNVGNINVERREDEPYPAMAHAAANIPPPSPGGHPGLVMPPPLNNITRVQGGMHPSIASEAFRKPHPPEHPQQQHPQQQHPQQHSAQMHFQTNMPPQQQQHPQQYYRHVPQPRQSTMVQHAVRRSTMEEAEATQYDPIPRHHYATPAPTGDLDEKQRSKKEHDNRESEVEFVLAKKYKALRTGETLGFPAYSGSKEILGFYRESSNKVGVGQFIPLSRHASDFGPMEMAQAAEVLEDAIQNKSHALHALKDWGSINNLIDHILVYQWSKDIGNEGSLSPSGDDVVE